MELLQPFCVLEEIIFLKCLFIYCWLHWVSFAVPGLPLIAASRGSSLVVVCRLLIVVASLIVEHELLGMRASAAAACGL